jgi:hypothetical protein
VKIPTEEEFWLAQKNFHFAFWNLPVFRITRHFREDHTEWRCADWYQEVWYDFDTDVYTYALEIIAPFVFLYYWWHSVRWRGEYWLCRIGVLEGQDGSHVKDAKFRRDFWNSKKWQRNVLKRKNVI